MTEPFRNSLGYEVIGHRPHCDCGQPGQYVEHWDLYACFTCDKWLEPPCECDFNCIFLGAPEKPSQT